MGRIEHDVSGLSGEIGGGGVGLHIESVDTESGRIRVRVFTISEMPRPMCVVKGFRPDEVFTLVPDMERSAQAGCAIWRMEGGPDEPFFMKRRPDGGKTFQHARELGLDVEDKTVV